jgi:N-acetylneuraminic acid mutarotase
MYVFGGILGNGENNEHVYQFDMNSNKWSKLNTTGDAPTPRDDHCLAQEEDTVYIFGGFSNGVRCNDLYKFSFESNAWECLFEHHPHEEIEPSTLFPVPRSGMAMGCSGDSIVIFGGRNDFNDMMNDTWEFSVS